MKHFATVLCVMCGFALMLSARAAEKPLLDKKVQDLLSKMTVEEKVGQMTQVTIDVVSQGADGKQEPHQLDRAKLEKAILQYHVGSILNVTNSAYTIDHWHGIITAIQDLATKQTRLKVPVLYGIDAIHGNNYTAGATIFPQAIAMAATWNADLAKEEGKVTALEMRASGIPWNFYPVLDIGRQPLWPRLWETFGEDVYLASVLGRSYIEGHQGSDFGSETTGATCLKHYVGYSQPINGKDRTPAWISERMLREYFLPTFEAAVRAGAPTVMVNSAEVDGIPGHCNYHLLTEILRGEMKFKGFVVSDWEDIKRLHTRDKVAATPKEAVRMAVMAGIDMSMVPLDFTFYDLLLECVKDGSVPMSRIDEAVGRILKVKYEMGLFERPYPNKALKSQFATKEAAALNLQAAQEAITLLKNSNHVLPLSKKARVLVTGPTATSLSAMNGGWTITWQGDADALYPKDKLNVLQAVEAAIGKDQVTYQPGATFTTAIDIDAAVKAATQADAILVCLGEKAYCETPGNIDDLTLDDAQLQLAEALIRTGKPVIVVLLEGRPRVINRIADGAAAVVMGYLPGLEGGRAIASVLFGDVNPSGKLPVSYPRSPNGVTPYDFKSAEIADVNRYNPQWPFGFGLSYTTFEYSNLQLSNATMGMNDTLRVRVTVKNTGRVAGKDAVQLYVNDNYGSVTRPARQVKGFQKVALEPGQQRDVEFLLTSSALSFIGINNTRVVEPGGFTVMVGELSKDFTLQ